MMASSSFPNAEPGVEKLEEMYRAGGVIGVVAVSDLERPRRLISSFMPLDCPFVGDRSGSAIDVLHRVLFMSSLLFDFPRYEWRVWSCDLAMRLDAMVAQSDLS